MRVARSRGDRGVVVRRDGLRVAVHHHGLVSERAEGLGRVDAAVVELDSLPDAVRPRAEDHHTRRGSRGRGLVVLAPRRVEVVRSGLDLARTRVDATVDGAQTYSVSSSAYFGSGQTENLSERVVAPPRVLRTDEVATRELVASLRNLLAEPRVEIFGEVLVGEARPRRRRSALELSGAMRFEERLRERPPDPHRFTHRLHLRAERLVGARELLEGEARELHDDVVERRLEARRRRLRQVVGDLVERVADRELGRHLRDGIARRLRGERRRARDARVHLDDAQLAGLATSRELDVRAARVDTDGADDRGGRVSQLLVRVVREGHLGSDGHRVARVHAHRIEVSIRRR